MGPRRMRAYCQRHPGEPYGPAHAMCAAIEWREEKGGQDMPPRNPRDQVIRALNRHQGDGRIQEWFYPGGPDRFAVRLNAGTVLELASVREVQLFVLGLEQAIGRRP